MKSITRLTLMVVALLCLAGAAAYGQAVYGSIYGTVTDSSGAVVPNAKVVITDQNKNTAFETTTNASGNYSRTQLIPGVYSVDVEATGFRKTVQKDISVSADASAKVDVTMTVGDVTQSVEVTGEAPLLKSDRSDVATSFTAKQLTELPSFGRNFQSYELLVPGAQKLGWAHASSENPQGSLQIEVNGQHFSGTGYQLDGTDNQDPILGIIVINPTLESITETKITTQNYDAEFGLAIAGMATAQTKSGSNSIHGSLFEFNRDNTPGFQTFARDPFAESDKSIPLPPVKWNQFGGSVGGPIKKDKLFYFGDIQVTRRRTGSSVLTSVPTALARTGDLSQYLAANSNNQIYNPFTGNADGTGRTPFANNVITPGLISPQAQKIMTLIPTPNHIDATQPAAYQPIANNYYGTGVEKFDTLQWNTRVDYFLNEKSQVFGRYSWASFNKHAPGAFGEDIGGPALNNINFAGKSDVRNQSLAAGYNHTFSPTLLTEFRFGFMRYRVNVLPNGFGTHPATDAGIPGLNNLNGDDFFTTGMPRFNPNGGDGGFDVGYSLGTNQCNCPLDEEEQQFQWINNTTKTHGNHNIKFGADIRYAMNLRVPSDSHRAGELYFNTGPTGIVAPGSNNTSQGMGLATFMLGQVTSFSRYVSPFTDAAERQKRFFWYVQDTWRATPKLTVNYGLRWEQIFPEKVNGPGRGGALDLSTGLINVYGVGGVSDHGIVDMNWKNFAPRLGITYQLQKNTVIRAGYGWSYALGTFGSIFGHNVTQNLPVLAYQNLNQSNSWNSVFDLATGPAAPTFPQPDSNGTFPLPNGISGKARPNPLKLNAVYAYNVTVQHQFTQNMSLEVGYVGNVGRNSFNGDGPNLNANQATWFVGQPNPSQDVRKPFFARYGWEQGIDWYCNCATTSYNSMQVRLERRFSHGYSLIGNYTLGKGMQDDGDSYTFLYNRALGRKVNDFDREHYVTLAQNWEVPIGKGRKFGSNMNRAADIVIGGWQLNGVTSWGSGLPFTPYYDAPAGFSRPDVGPSGRPDKGSGSPYAHNGRDGWIVYDPDLTGPFRLPAPNTFGNYGDQTLRGPGFFQQDMSLFKNFKFTESKVLELRFEAYNVFNTTNLGGPDTNVTSGDAGKIHGLAYSGGDSALGLMRRLQFGLHFSF